MHHANNVFFFNSYFNLGCYCRIQIRDLSLMAGESEKAQDKGKDEGIWRELHKKAQAGGICPFWAGFRLKVIHSAQPIIGTAAFILYYYAHTVIVNAGSIFFIRHWFGQSSAYYSKTVFIIARRQQWWLCFSSVHPSKQRVVTYAPQNQPDLPLPYTPSLSLSVSFTFSFAQDKEEALRWPCYCCCCPNLVEWVACAHQSDKIFSLWLLVELFPFVCVCVYIILYPLFVLMFICSTCF